jgi:hypothetical protein
MYTIVDGVVYYTWKTRRSTITQYVGIVNQYKITETETQTIYQWQIWIEEENSYADDVSNTTPIIIDGVEHTPTNGQVVIQKTTT